MKSTRHDFFVLSVTARICIEYLHKGQSNCAANTFFDVQERGLFSYIITNWGPGGERTLKNERAT
jgi:hypothetical protein